MQDTHLKMRGIAHDINGLMTRASLAAEHLAAHSDPAVNSHAGNIVEAIDRVTEICRQELTQSSKMPGDRDDCHYCIGQLVQQVVDIVGVDHLSSATEIMFSQAVERDLNLTRHASSLFRVIFNLTLNAARAIAQHGGSWIEIEVVQDYDRVFIEISDDGPGLPDHVLGYLYPRADGGIAPQGPIGAGLVTTASLAREIGGELRLIKSTPAGTRFCVVVPKSNLCGGPNIKPSLEVLARSSPEREPIVA